MHIAKFASLASLLTVVGCVCCGSFDAEKNSAVSPDGRNEIRLYSMRSCATEWSSPRALKSV